jgi:quercetin dioxygenase-like cupin family protein
MNPMSATHHAASTRHADTARGAPAGADASDAAGRPAVIGHTDARRTVTPAATMTTLASPTQGGANQPVWRVDMSPTASGPTHAIDAQQVWTVLDGGATVEIDGDVVAISAGDTVVIPADVRRRITAHDAGLSAIVVAPAGMRAYAPSVDVSPTCAVPDGDKLIPAWTV